MSLAECCLAEYHCTECVIPSVAMLSVIMLSVFFAEYHHKECVMLSDVKLSVVMLSVVAPTKEWNNNEALKHFKL